MREACRGGCVLIIVFGVPTAAIAWTNDRPTSTDWLLRIVCSVASVAAIIAFLFLRKPSDVVDTNPKLSSGRQRFNRWMGLSSYAGGVVLLGLMASALIDEGGIKDDLGLYVLGGIAAIACFAIGYTTGRKS
jgi:hypothetical protein